MLINSEAGTQSSTILITSRQQGRARWKAPQLSTVLVQPHGESNDGSLPSQQWQSVVVSFPDFIGNETKVSVCVCAHFV